MKKFAANLMLVVTLSFFSHIGIVSGNQLDCVTAGKMQIINKMYGSPFDLTTSEGEKLTDYRGSKELLKKEYHEVINLILVSGSMKHEERQDWFHKLPNMTSDQVTSLEKILEREAYKLLKIDCKYKK